MSKILITLPLLLTLNSFAQYSSYSDIKADVQLIFNLDCYLDYDVEQPQQFILSAKENYEIHMQTSTQKNLKSNLRLAFELADCLECKLVSEIITEKPIESIFELIEYQDVFLVKVHEDQYKVIRYQPKE